MGIRGAFRRIRLPRLSSPAARAGAARGTAEPGLTAGISATSAGLTVGQSFPPVQLPALRTVTGARARSLTEPLTVAADPVESTYLVRGSIPDEATAPTYSDLMSHPDVVGVFSDPVIE